MYKKNRNSYKLVCRTKKLQAMTKRRAKLIGCRNDARKFWSLLKSVNDTSEGSVPVPPVVFLDHFKSLLNPISSGEIPDFSFLNSVVQRHDCPELNRPITDQEIVSSIKSLNINKAPGPDGICLEMYKHTVNEILPFLFKLFNEIFDVCDFPEQWSRSTILPIHKKGNLKDPDNYRGISLMDSICKNFMHVLNTRLTEWCDFNNVIDEAQAGFRKKYLTTDNIFVLISLVQKYLTKKRGRFYCIFIDFSKAFDSIRHDKLWESMERKGISGNYLKIFKSLYSKLRSCIKANGKVTEYFNCTIGSRQGCVASPKLFSIFINDLVDLMNEECGRGIFVTNEIHDMRVLMFADDVSNFADTVFQLQKQINCIEKFTKGVGLQVNIEKKKKKNNNNGIQKWRRY